MTVMFPNGLRSTKINYNAIHHSNTNITSFNEKGKCKLTRILMAVCIRLVPLSMKYRADDLDLKVPNGVCTPKSVIWFPEN